MMIKIKYARNIMKNIHLIVKTVKLILVCIGKRICVGK